MITKAGASISTDLEQKALKKAALESGTEGSMERDFDYIIFVKYFSTTAVLRVRMLIMK